MSRSDRPDLTATALTDLDAAPATTLTPAQQQRAEQTLVRILAEPALAGTGGIPVERRRRWSTRVPLLVAAAAAVAVVVSATGVLGGGTAYASWTARPTLLAPAEQDSLAQECRDYLAEGADGAHATPEAVHLRQANLVLADTRGDWSYVVLAGADDLEATCLIERPKRPGLGSRITSASGSYGFIARATPATDGIVGSGLMAMGTDEGSYWSTDGWVGADVEGVTIVTAGGTEVEATVIDGRFAAWWPDRLDLDSSPADDPLADVRYLVTLADGTVRGPMSYDRITSDFTQ